MHGALIVPMAAHPALASALHALLTVARAPAVWRMGRWTDGGNPRAGTNRASAPIFPTRSNEWPLFFHVACLVLPQLPSSPTALAVPWLRVEAAGTGALMLPPGRQGDVAAAVRPPATESSSTVYDRSSPSPTSRGAAPDTSRCSSCQPRNRRMIISASSSTRMARCSCACADGRHTITQRLPVPAHAEFGNDLLLFFRVNDFDQALQRARQQIPSLAIAPSLHPGTGTPQFAVRDPAGCCMVPSAQDAA
jgi:hypothetical protein